MQTAEYELVLNLLDMTGYGKEKYFLEILVHPGWKKGWTSD
ncbi:MAG: hypothetical protein ACLTKE_07495 [Coprococcus sp.]